MRSGQPKARLCRREGVNLFGSDKYDKILARRTTKPGRSPKDRPAKISEYGRQLREKQKAKRMYGVSEKQFRRAFAKATTSKAVTGSRLLQLLELRLDNVIYRAGFAMTRPQARQFVSHKQFLVNGRAVDVPSIEVKVGDVITVRDRFENNIIFESHSDRIRMIPKWLCVDAKKKTITIERLPDAEEVEQAISVHMIVEFYSR